MWCRDAILFTTLFTALLEISERIRGGGGAVGKEGVWHFSIFIMIWVTFEMVDLTQSKERKSQEKIVKIWAWQGINEGTAAAWENDSWAGVFVTATAIAHYLSVWTDWYLIMVKKEPN